MLQISTYRGSNVPPDIAAKCAEYLCKSDSPMRSFFLSLEAGEPVDDDCSLTVAIATKIENDEIVPVGWAAVETWRGLPALQGFVYPIFRRRGLASALCSMLTAEGKVPLARVSVFSPHFRSIAVRCGFLVVDEWKRVDDGYVAVNPETQEPDGWIKV